MLQREDERLGILSNGAFAKDPEPDSGTYPS